MIALDVFSRVHPTRPSHASRSCAQRNGYLAGLIAPRGMLAWLPGAKQRHERSVAEARAKYETALSGWRQNEAQRLAELAALETEHAEAALVSRIRRNSGTRR